MRIAFLQKRDAIIASANAGTQPGLATPLTPVLAMPAAVDNGPSKLTPDLRNLFTFARTEPGEVGAAPAYPEHYQKVAEEQDDLRHLYL